MCLLSLSCLFGFVYIFVLRALCRIICLNVHIWCVFKLCVCMSVYVSVYMLVGVCYFMCVCMFVCLCKSVYVSVYILVGVCYFM